MNSKGYVMNIPNDQGVYLTIIACHYHLAPVTNRQIHETFPGQVLHPPPFRLR
jgi:hypothetical protein